MVSPARADQSKQLRAPFGWPLGIITLIIGLLFAATSLTSRAGKPSLGAIGFGVIVMAGSYILGIRPGVGLKPAGLEIRNPLRRAYIPWDELQALKSADVLMVTDVHEHMTRCYAISGTLRSLKRVQAAEAEVQEWWDAAKRDGTSGGTLSYGINASSWVGLATLVIGVCLLGGTILGLFK